MSTPLVAGRRYRLLIGNTFTVDAPVGAQLMFQAEGGAVETVTADADGASFEPTAAGRYYVAYREDSSEDYRRAGVVVVDPLVDPREEMMVAELEAIEALLAAPNTLVQYQMSDPSGTAATRMTVASLSRHRAVLETRLARYRRRKAGVLPVRMC